MTHADQITTLLQVIADLQAQLQTEKAMKTFYAEKYQALKAETDNDAESEKA